MARAGPPMPDPVLARARSIAVLRANGLGDYLLGEPALAALRAAAPQVHVVLIGSDWHARALRGRPGPVDEVVVAPWSAGVRTPRPPHREDPVVTQAFFMAMRARRFDLAVQLHGGGRNSNPFVRSLGAGHAIGLRTPDAVGLDRTVAYEYWQHEIPRYLEVVSLVGADPVRLAPQFSVTDVDQRNATWALVHAGVDPDHGIAVLHPGASDPRRRWPPQRFAEVGVDLVRAGAQVVVVGTADEQDLVDQVVARCPSATSLAGRLGIGSLAAVLSRAAVVVANDSGPRHLAEAVGAPTVSVYWFGNVINAGPLTRDRHKVHISWTTRCPVCAAPCVGDWPDADCPHRCSFVTDVPVARVSSSALEVYAGSSV